MNITRKFINRKDNIGVAKEGEQIILVIPPIFKLICPQ